jgi:hypothetical protein
VAAKLLRGCEAAAWLRSCVAAKLRGCEAAWLRSCVAAKLRGCEAAAWLRSCCVAAKLRGCEAAAWLRSCCVAAKLRGCEAAAWLRSCCVAAKLLRGCEAAAWLRSCGVAAKLLRGCEAAAWLRGWRSSLRMISLPCCNREIWRNPLANLARVEFPPPLSCYIYCKHRLLVSPCCQQEPRLWEATTMASAARRRVC